jgi:hypothetical protein
MTRKVSRRVDRFWKRLAMSYGSRLFEQYGENAPEDWAAVIDRTDDERLETALFAVRRESPNHPPTLGQLEAAIPGRTFGPETPSKPQTICDYALRTIGKELCRHQIARPWTYFGPTREYVRGNTVTTYVDPRGVWVPPCEPCERPEHRVIPPEVS